MSRLLICVWCFHKERIVMNVEGGSMIWFDHVKIDNKIFGFNKTQNHESPFCASLQGRQQATSHVQKIINRREIIRNSCGTWLYYNIYFVIYLEGDSVLLFILLLFVRLLLTKVWPCCNGWGGVFTRCCRRCALTDRCRAWRVIITR